MSFPASFLYTYPFTWGSWNAGLALGLLVPNAGKRHEVASIDEGYWATHLDQTTRVYVSVPTAALGVRKGRWALGLTVNLRLAEIEEQNYHSGGSSESTGSAAGQEFQDMTFRSLDLMALSAQSVLGLQVALAKGWRAGLVLRTPGLHLWSRGKVTAVAFEGMPDWWCEPGDQQTPGCWYYYDVKGGAKAREPLQGSVHFGLGWRKDGSRNAFELSGAYWFPSREDQALTTLVGDDQDADLVNFGDGSVYLPAAWQFAMGAERQLGPLNVLRLGLSYRWDSASLQAVEAYAFDQVWQTTGLSLGYSRKRMAKMNQSASTSNIALRFEHLAGRAVGLQWTERGNDEPASESFRLVTGSGYRLLCVLGGSFDLSPASK
jgi:hypothetical protein